jgi:hypothetical protein
MPKKRIVQTKELLPLLHIYCEGEKTEPNYINGYLNERFAGDRRKRVIKVEPTKKNTPVQLVEVATKHKNSKFCPEDDVFWVVYDRESPAKYPRALHQQAYQLAEENGVGVAFSNICFELWLLLHMQNNSAPYISYDNFINESQFKAELAKLGLSNYDKGCGKVYGYLRNGLSTARQRAQAMNAISKNSAPKGQDAVYDLNPYCDVYVLLDAIDAFP